MSKVVTFGKWWEVWLGWLVGWKEGNGGEYIGGLLFIYLFIYFLP